MAFIPAIIIYFNAIFIQLRLLVSAIFKAMQVYLNTQLVERFYFPEQVEYASIINGVGNIEADDM